jgi:hypothetical protein
VLVDHRPKEVERGTRDTFQGSGLHPNEAELPGESFCALPRVGQAAMEIAADVHAGGDRIVDRAEMAAQVVDPSLISDPVIGTAAAF